MEITLVNDKGMSVRLNPDLSSIPGYKNGFDVFYNQLLVMANTLAPTQNYKDEDYDYFLDQFQGFIPGSPDRFDITQASTCNWIVWLGFDNAKSRNSGRGHDSFLNDNFEIFIKAVCLKMGWSVPVKNGLNSGRDKHGYILIQIYCRLCKYFGDKAHIIYAILVAIAKKCSTAEIKSCITTNDRPLFGTICGINKHVINNETHFVGVSDFINKSLSCVFQMVVGLQNLLVYQTVVTEIERSGSSVEDFNFWVYQTTLTDSDVATNMEKHFVRAAEKYMEEYVVISDIDKDPPRADDTRTSAAPIITHLANLDVCVKVVTDPKLYKLAGYTKLMELPQSLPPPEQILKEFEKNFKTLFPKISPSSTTIPLFKKIETLIKDIREFNGAKTDTEFTDLANRCMFDARQSLEDEDGDGGSGSGGGGGQEAES